MATKDTKTTTTTKKTTPKAVPKATPKTAPKTTPKNVEEKKEIAKKAAPQSAPATKTPTSTKASNEIKAKDSADKKTDDKAAKDANVKKDRKKLINSKTIFKQDAKIALSLKNVQKSFGFKQVLKGVTFDIKKGERLALIGKNGAGKSTLINVIAQQTKMSEGEIRYGYASNRVESLERMGIQFQALNYPEGFIVKDVIKFFNASVDKSIRMSNKELADMISMFGIDKFLNQAIDRLSGGQQQRINILLALIKKPHLLILDEISTGLDVESSEVIKGYIDQYLQKYPETALLLISHSDEEIREMSERVVVLEAGKIVENFESKKLTNKLFLEITSREPKLTKKEKEKAEKESEFHLQQLRRRYGFYKHLQNKLSGIPNEFMDGDNAVEIRGLSKTYGKSVGAVRNFTLDIKEGSRIAITGPNGSGKTTIVEIIAQVKTADKERNKFKNLKNLAKADYNNALKKLDEDLNVTIRQARNKYRLDRELAYNEAKELDRTKKKANKEEIEKQVNEMINKANAKADKERDKVEALKEKLEAEKVIKQKELAKTYEETLKHIEEQKEKKAQDPNYRYDNGFILNGKELKGREYSSPKPKIAYKFAESLREVRDNVGVQFQYASFPVEMTVLDVLLFFSRTNKNALSKEEMVEAVSVFKLEKLLKARAHSLSGGERQRLNVLLAIMKSPKLLILDEISTGLDVDSVVKIDAFIKDYLDRTNATLILISHNYHEVDSLTDKIVVMKYGKLTEVVDTEDWTTKQTKDKMREIYSGGGN